jgi:hypothetical protein
LTIEIISEVSKALVRYRAAILERERSSISTSDPRDRAKAFGLVFGWRKI